MGEGGSQHRGGRRAGHWGQDLPSQGPAAAPGRQRIPTSRAWSWPRCGPATGVPGVLRAKGWVPQEKTQSLHTAGKGMGTSPCAAPVTASVRTLGPPGRPCAGEGISCLPKLGLPAGVVGRGAKPGREGSAWCSSARWAAAQNYTQGRADAAWDQDACETEASRTAQLGSCP